MSTASGMPVYFELSWSILSTIGLANVLFGILVVGITTMSQIAAVPIVTSAAGAIANGLCYYAFYDESNPVKNQAAASGFADLMWMIQEAGLSFYSYVILSRVLRNKQWYIFAGLFWAMIVAIVVIRAMIAIYRIRFILGGDDALQAMVNHLHIGYFVLIAVLECLSAYFLLTTFASAKTTSLKAAIKTGLFQYLMRSTEVRLALLAILGTMRAITYSFQTAAQSATNVASQLDRFAYTMECVFPVIMFIDILASKLVFSNQVYDSSSRSRQAVKSHPRKFVTSRNDEGTHSHSRVEHVVEVQGGGRGGEARTSSQEFIIEGGGSSGTAPSDIDLEVMDPRRVGISKTVEFEVYESENRMRQ